MQFLVTSETRVHGPGKFSGQLPRPKPRTPFFGEETLTPELRSEMGGLLHRFLRAGISGAAGSGADGRPGGEGAVYAGLVFVADSGPVFDGAVGAAVPAEPSWYPRWRPSRNACRKRACRTSPAGWETTGTWSGTFPRATGFCCVRAGESRRRPRGLRPVRDWDLRPTSSAVPRSIITSKRTVAKLLERIGTRRHKTTRFDDAALRQLGDEFAELDARLSCSIQDTTRI